ncbi:MAG: DUF4156 domain-containing protein [Sneathiellales bacterium]|nr:DUF4156 domain-containing protein [Sneathiellales bacterium]
MAALKSPVSSVMYGLAFFMEFSLMSRLIRSFLFAGSLVLLGACVTLTSSGKKVREAKSEDLVQDCTRLGQVEAPSPFTAFNDSRTILKNKAGSLGGNTIYITDFIIGSAKATVYRC